MTIDVRVRDEEPADAGAIHDVVARAFERTDEARLVDALEAARERFAPASTLALIPGADHFFGGHLDGLAARVVELVTSFAD